MLRSLPTVRGFTYFFRELLGRHPIDASLVQVTDGGHYENLGLVEALREAPVPLSTMGRRLEDDLGYFLAAAAAEPALLVPLQEAADGWQARLVDDGLDPATATVVRLACDGLWLCDLFGLASPRGDLRARVAILVEEMTGEPS